MQIDATLPIMMIPPVEGKPEMSVAVQPQPAATNEIEKIDQAIGELARAVEPFDIALKFSKDQETGMIVIQMISQNTGETLQQIPNEAMLNVAATLGKLQGIIFNRVA